MTSFPLFYELNDSIPEPDPAMARWAERVARLAMNERMIFARDHRIPLTDTDVDLAIIEGHLAIITCMRRAND